VYAGSEISSFYDPMIAKVIVHAASRPIALRVLRHTLRHTPLLGCTNNRSFLHTLLGEEAVRQNEIDTGYVERTTHPSPESTYVTICAISVLLNKESSDGWSTRGVLRWPIILDVNGEDVSFEVEREGNGYTVLFGDVYYFVTVMSLTDSKLTINVDGHCTYVFYCWVGSTLFVDEQLAVSVVRIQDPYSRSSALQVSGRLVAPMMGRVVSVASSLGKTVQVGETIVVIEAMKMEHPVRAQIDGILESFHVTVGEQVSAEQLLGVVAPLESNNE
jgi:geranyl-CoA carboxylase alpha subunit